MDAGLGTVTGATKVSGCWAPQPFRAAPDFAPSTTETRGVPNLFCCSCRKGSDFEISVFNVAQVFRPEAFYSQVKQKNRSFRFLDCPFQPHSKDLHYAHRIAPLHRVLVWKWSYVERRKSRRSKQFRDGNLHSCLP
jgi:hypothetical protein